jgi:hydroxymethylpyrimidine pyrophosphatase-like HAD family hydrolase
MQTIRLIATDLDGTLIGSAKDLPLYTPFRDKINELRRRYNTVWVVCTGRTMETFREFFTPMRMMGSVPDFVIIRHAYIYGLTRFGYMPHLFWNLEIRYLLLMSDLNTREVIDEWEEQICHSSIGVTTVKKRRDRLWLRFDCDEAAGAAADMLKAKLRPYHHLQVFKYLKEVDVRPVPFTKGLAVSELAQHLGIGRDAVLAIGNGHNDISMLDGRIAKLTGCPANSEAEVLETVHRTGGHVATGNSLAGVNEILDAYMTDTVKSDLPATWENPTTMPYDKPRRLERQRQKRPRVLNPWLAALMGYMILLALASFGLIPFSRWIMWPFTFMVDLIAKIVVAITG